VTRKRALYDRSALWFIPGRLLVALTTAHQVPSVDGNGHWITGRALATADKRRAILERLYTHDLRAAPWAGTAHGIVQALSTYEHHEGVIRGAERAERNKLRTLVGDFGSWTTPLFECSAGCSSEARSAL
jgi:hypothetical protein